LGAEEETRADLSLFREVKEKEGLGSNPRKAAILVRSYFVRGKNKSLRKKKVRGADIDYE